MSLTQFFLYLIRTLACISAREELEKKQYRLVLHIRMCVRHSPSAGAHLDFALSTSTTRDKKRWKRDQKTAVLKSSPDAYISCHFGIKGECDRMQIVGFAAESETPGKAGAGRYLEVCSFTEAPPR